MQVLQPGQNLLGVDLDDRLIEAPKLGQQRGNGAPWDVLQEDVQRVLSAVGALHPGHEHPMPLLSPAGAHQLQLPRITRTPPASSHLCRAAFLLICAPLCTCQAAPCQPA